MNRSSGHGLVPGNAYENGSHAVKDMDMEVADGEFMVLVGPSGCGKTTTLRMVAGLEDTTSGILRIGGKVVNDETPKERDIAMVFQNTEWLDRKPGQLSGGQRQRVAMGRAIVREPSVFLMDEPLSNLDAKLRVQMRAEVQRIQRRINVATIYVTDDQIEAMTMGDRVIVIRDGMLQQADTPQTLYDHRAVLPEECEDTGSLTQRALPHMGPAGNDGQEADQGEFSDEFQVWRASDPVPGSEFFRRRPPWPTKPSARPRSSTPRRRPSSRSSPTPPGTPRSTVPAGSASPSTASR